MISSLLVFLVGWGKLKFFNDKVGKEFAKKLSPDALQLLIDSLSQLIWKTVSIFLVFFKHFRDLFVCLLFFFKLSKNFSYFLYLFWAFWDLLCNFFLFVLLQNSQGIFQHLHSFLWPFLANQNLLDLSSQFFQFMTFSQVYLTYCWMLFFSLLTFLCSNDMHRKWNVFVKYLTSFFKKLGWIVIPQNSVSIP